MRNRAFQRLIYALAVEISDPALVEENIVVGGQSDFLLLTGWGLLVGADMLQMLQMLPR